MSASSRPVSRPAPRSASTPPRRTISLSGAAWEVGEGAVPAAWIPARVPGNVQEDLWRAGLRPDPYVGANADAYRDCEQATWTYRRVFEMESLDPADEWHLQLDAVDYEAEVALNGQVLAHHEGMYSQLTLDPGRALRAGRNELRVTFLPLRLAPRASRAVVDPLAPLRHDGRWMARSLMGFFWDFAPRLVPTGIWKDVRLLATGGAWLHSPRVDCELAANQEEARLIVHALASVRTARGASASFELFEPNSTRPVVSVRSACTLAPGEHALTLDATLPGPRLWWPNGMGDQFLYDAVLRVEDGGETLDELCWSVGVRTVTMIRTPKDQAEQTTIPATSQKNETMLVVNGQPIGYRGINVAPMDVLFGRIDDARIETQMRLARDAGLNFLRVWGGGIIARDSFYDLADRWGIMLWQEMPLGCTDHEGSDHYRAVLAQEARSIILGLRRHPSLVAWCGGNELFLPQSGMGPQDATVRMLASLAWTLDPQRIYLPTTPYPGAFHGPYTFDCFGQGGFGGAVDHVQFCNTAPDGAYNECGVAGPSLPSVIRAAAPAAEVWPPRRGGAWEYHKAFGAWGDGNTWLLPELLERYFGPLSTLGDLCRAGQFLQAIGLQYLLEEMRRRWPDVPGTMPWCFNTPWTSFAGSFVVAYPDTPLPAYFTMQRAYSPRSISARLASFVARPGAPVTAAAFVLNDSREPAGAGRAVIEIGPLHGEAWARTDVQTPEVPLMGRIRVAEARAEVPADFAGVIVVKLSWNHPGGVETSTYWLGATKGGGAEACYRPLLDLWARDPAARLKGME